MRNRKWTDGQFVCASFIHNVRYTITRGALILLSVHTKLMRLSWISWIASLWSLWSCEHQQLKFTPFFIWNLEIHAPMLRNFRIYLIKHDWECYKKKWDVFNSYGMCDPENSDAEYTTLSICTKIEYQRVENEKEMRTIWKLIFHNAA